MRAAFKEVDKEVQRMRASVEKKRNSIRSVVGRLEDWIREDEAKRNGTRLLVLDDEEFIGRAFVRAAKKHGGVSVDHALTLDDAVTAVSRISYDGCVVDVGIGIGGLGTNFCEHVRTRSMRPLMPLVLYTGEADATVANEAARRCGANLALLKSEHSIDETIAILVKMCASYEALAR